MPSPARKSKSPTTLEADSSLLGGLASLSPTIENNQTDSAIEIDESVQEDDDGYESGDGAVDTTSLASTLRRFPLDQYGRSYHKYREGKYKFPNDAEEQNREDMKHAMIVVHICQDALHYAPIGETPQAILDLGPGTGIWAIEMADKYPSAAVTGIDLSPIQPDWIPPNLNFIIDDLEDVEAMWGPGPDHFDFVHARHMAMGFLNWPQAVSRSFHYAKPGGYLELQELGYYPKCDDGTLENYAYKGFVDLVKEGFEKLREDSIQPQLFVAPQLKGMLIDSGFINVEERILKVPLGVWPEDRRLRTAGAFLREIALDILVPLSRLTLGMGLKWSQEEIETYLVGPRLATRHLWVDGRGEPRERIKRISVQKPRSAYTIATMAFDY